MTREVTELTTSGGNPLSSRLWPPLLQPVVAPAGAHGFPAAPRPQPLIGSLGAREIRGRGLGGAAWGGRAAPDRERGLRGPAAWGLGPHGHPGAGPMATAEARGSAGPGGRGESPGARALRRGRRQRWAHAHRVWRLLEPEVGGGRARTGGARPLGLSVVGGAWVEQAAPQAAPAHECGPGRAAHARLGGAQWTGPR